MMRKSGCQCFSTRRSAIIRALFLKKNIKIHYNFETIAAAITTPIKTISVTTDGLLPYHRRRSMVQTMREE